MMKVYRKETEKTKTNQVPHTPKPVLALAVKEATPKPRLELTPGQISRLKTTAEIILTLIGVAGLVMVSVAAPNALRVFKQFSKQQNREPESFKDRRKRLMRSFYYLKHKNFIELQPKDNDFKIKLTLKGHKKIAALKLRILEIKKPFVWDRKFWQVAADIPVEFRKAADALRKKLKTIGFYSLQRSLWFYPYDPRKGIRALTEEYQIDQFVTVMKIASFDPADHKVLYDFFKETGVIEF